MNCARRFSLTVALLVFGVACTDPPTTLFTPPPPAVPPPPPLPGHEREPNNTLAAADTVVLGDSVIGKVALPGDVDYFAVRLEAGTNVAFVSTDLRSLRDWKWMMDVLDSTGVVLAEYDEYVDWLPGTRIWYTVRTTGQYYVRLYNYPLWSGAQPSSDSVAYTLRITPFRTVQEREPDDHVGQSNLVAMGDTVSGILTPGDSDYYALDLTAGTNLNLEVSSLEVSCNVVPEIRLLTADGRELDREDSSPYNGSFNPRLEYVIPATGRYYVAFRVYFPPGAVGNPCYFLKIGTFTLPPPGPAEPIQILAQAGRYDAIAAGRGEVYVASGICQTPERSANNTVARLEDDGTLTTIADHLALTGDIAVDRSGNVLVPGIDSRHGVVWRISPSGERSVFVNLQYAPCALAVGPEGEVWVTEYATGHTTRFDSLGSIEATVELGTYVVQGLKVSPRGVLYFRRNGFLFKLENGDTTRLMVLQGPQAWTFDRDGNLYVTSYNEYFGGNLYNKLVLLDPALHSLIDPVAYANYPVGMTFVPDPSGRPTHRLLVLYHPDMMQGDGVIGELNAAGVRAPGP